MRKKIMATVLVFNILIWSLGTPFFDLGIKPVNALVEVAIQPQGVTMSGNGDPLGVPINANSSDTAVIGFQLWQDAGETLSYVHTTISASGTVSPGDISSLKVYLDNGDMSFNSASDTEVGSSTIVNINATTTIGCMDAIGASNTPSYYFITFSTGPGWDDSTNDSIIFSMAADGIQTTAVSPVVNPIASTTAFYADTTGPDIVAVEYVNDRKFDIIFNEDVRWYTASSTSQYTLSAGSVTNISQQMNVIQVETDYDIVIGSTTVSVAATVEDWVGNTIIDTTAQIVAAAQRIKISEISAMYDGGDREFIELYNPTGASIDISGWSIQKSNASPLSWTTLASVGSASILAHKFFLIASDTLSPKDLSMDSTGKLPIAGGHVRIYTGSKEIDKVGWGTAISPEGYAAAAMVSGNSLERRAFPGASATDMASGGMDENMGNSFDTDNNSNDLVLQDSPNPQYSGSPAEEPNMDDFGGSMYINHMPINWAATEADLEILAQMSDPLTPNTGELTTQLFYMIGDGSPGNSIVSEYTIDAGEHQGSGIFKFIIPQSTINSSSANGIYYFLKLSGNGGTRYMSASPAADQVGVEATIAQHPFEMDVSAAGAFYTIYGTVTLNGTSTHSGIMVMLEGTGYSTTTNSAGLYTISAPNGMYDVFLYKEGYYDKSINDIHVNDANKFLPAQVLYEGNSGGASGDATIPIVKWTGPSDGQVGIPAGQPTYDVFVGFSKNMNGSSFSSSTIYFTTDGVTPIPSTMTEYDNDVSDNAAAERPEDSYLGVVRAPAGGFNPGTSYYLVLTDGLRDTSGNSLEGNRTGGGHVISFTTNNDLVWDDFGSGAMMPPWVTDVRPGPGTINNYINTTVTINFSDSMNSGTVNSTNIKLYTVLSDGTNGSNIPINVSLDTSGRIGLIDPASNLSPGKHRVVISGALKSAAGIWMGDPSQGYNLSTYEFYRSSFEVGSQTDLTAPTILGNWPVNNDIGIAVNPGPLSIQFSEGLNPSTVNNNTVSLKRGSSIVNAVVDYNSNAYNVSIVPNVLLANNTVYTLTLTGSTTGISDMSGNYLAADTIITFTTSNTEDTQSPSIMYANGDDYSIAVSFSETMNSANRTDSEGWPTSILNPGNYIVKWGDYADVSTAGTVIDLISIGSMFYYDAVHSTVIIDNLGLNPASTTNKDYYIELTSASVSASGTADLAGNLLSTATDFQMPIYNSSDTFGFLGPGNMIDPNMDDMGMMMAGAFPMNSMAGQKTIYFVDIPTSRVIPTGGKITLTFPTGFDVSLADKDAFSPINNDINEWNVGAVTIASVTGDLVTNKVTITTGGSPTVVSDYLHMDISGIVNSLIPRGYETSGYNVDIKTYDGSDNLLESINTMPFYITGGGSATLKVTISGVQAADVDGTADTVRVYLGSPMTGPMELVINLANDGTGSSTYTGLPVGDYHMFTDPLITLDSSDYAGQPMTEPIWVNAGSNSKTITLTKEAAGGGLMEIDIDITGVFGTDDIDIFAGSPNGFKVKTITGAGTNPSNIKLYLGDGDWMLGMGPAMPTGVISGPPPMPDWMPPMPVQIKISGNGTVATESSGTANDGTVIFTVISANKEIIGYVKDGNDVAIGDAEVWAYQPMGTGMGAHTKTDTSGKFTLKVAENGNYKVGAFKPGLPYIAERGVEIKTNTGAVDGNATADVYRDSGSLITAGSPFTIKIKKPDYTISGRVTDGANAVAYAPVWAYRSDGSGHADTMSDASGNYVLYVDNGTWVVNGYIPGFGDVDPKTVVINSTSETQNLAPLYTGSQLITITGTVSDGSPMIYMPIRAVQYNDSGVYTGREFGGQSDSSGSYSISVPTNAKYRVDIWTPEYGEVGLNLDEVANNPANVIATTTDRTGRDITINTANLRTVYFNLNNAQAGQEGFLNVDGVDFSGSDPIPNGFHIFERFSDLSVASNTIQLPDGDYFIYLDVPGVGSYIPDAVSRGANDQVTVSGSNRSVDITLLDLASNAVAISGTVYADSESGGNEIADAWVWVGNPVNGYHSGTQTATDGTYSLTIPIGSGYKFGADKPGYMSAEPSDLNATTSLTGQNFVLNSYALSISGYVYYDTNSDGDYDSGEEVTNGFVRAETTKCSDSAASGECVKTHTPVDGSGYYELGVVNGTWKVYSMGDGYYETEHTAEVTISGSSASVNIKLAIDNNWTNASKKKPMTPASGGSMDDTAPNGTGVKLTIPPNAMGNSSAAGNVNAQKTKSIPKTNSSDPIGGEGVNITATDNSGQAITNLNDYIDLEMVVYKAEVEAGIASGTISYAKLKSTKNGYWDSTTNDWVNLTSNRKAYYKVNAGDSEWILYKNTATTTPAFEAFINTVAGGTSYGDYKLVYTSKTNHFTIFAVIMPFIVTPAQGAPEDPPPVTPPSGGGGGGISYCASVEYGDWGECSDEIQNREVVSKTPSSCRLTSTQETDKKRDCQTESEVNAEETVITTEQATSLSTVDVLYLAQGDFIKRGEIEEIMRGLGITERNHVGEQLSRSTLINRLGIKINEFEPAHQYALTNYITYGSPDTKIGWGERAGVLNSFMAAFAKVPLTADDWSDIIKIANGRWPTQRSEAAELKSYEHFRKIYLREPDRANPHDDASVTVIAYGLRPVNRNMDSEAAAIRIFKAIYGYHPTGATDWDIVRSIAYSGATR